MARALPPLNALKSFEAAARCKSFTKAADELCVTQGAVSQQVKALEQDLRTKLFMRHHHRLILTEHGQRYFAVVSDALQRITVGTEQLRNQTAERVLNVSTSPDFAAKWLVHRLDRFSEACPEIDLRVSASMHHVDFVAENIDVAVRHGIGDWKNIFAEKLCAEDLFVVCSPQLAAQISNPQDILKFPLLHTESHEDWDVWLSKAHIERSAVMRGPVFNRVSLTIEAALDGQGLALSRTTLAAFDILKGRLVAPLAISLALSRSYWIVCPNPTSNLEKIKKFRDWAKNEAASDIAQLKVRSIID